MLELIQASYPSVCVLTVWGFVMVWIKVRFMQKDIDREYEARLKLRDEYWELRREIEAIKYKVK